MVEDNDNSSHDEQVKSSDANNETVIEANDYNPYQTSQTSFEANTPHQTSLKSLSIRFCLIYLLTYVIFFALMLLLIFITNGALWMLAMWLFAFSFVVIPYMTYHRCLKRIPPDAPPSIFSQFKAISVVIAIALPFVVSILFFGLCTAILGVRF